MDVSVHQREGRPVWEHTDSLVREEVNKAYVEVLVVIEGCLWSVPGEYSCAQRLCGVAERAEVVQTAQSPRGLPRGRRYRPGTDKAREQHFYPPSHIQCLFREQERGRGEHEI